jgi:hypothetical protein
MSAVELDEGVLWQRALEELAPSGLGRPVPAASDPACVGPVPMKPAGKVGRGVLGLLWRVVRDTATHAEDRRVTVSLHSADSSGAPGVVVYAPNNHGHIYIELATQGKGTE